MTRNFHDRITDYDLNEESIKKWIRVKGEIKYAQFADILDGLGIETSWKNVSDLYKYDKRLLFNNFKYFSFFEEYTRAIILNHSADDGNERFEWIHEKYFSELGGLLFKMDSDAVSSYFDCDELSAKLRDLNKLRNEIAHNRIIIQYPRYKESMRSFFELLPPDYRDNYKNDIDDCKKKLSVPDVISRIFD